MTGVACDKAVIVTDNCWFSLSRHKKVNPKLLSEKTQEYYRL